MALPRQQSASPVPPADRQPAPDSAGAEAAWARARAGPRGQVWLGTGLQAASFWHGPCPRSAAVTSGRGAARRAGWARGSDPDPGSVGTGGSPTSCPPVTPSSRRWGRRLTGTGPPRPECPAGVRLLPRPRAGRGPLPPVGMASAATPTAVHLPPPGDTAPALADLGKGRSAVGGVGRREGAVLC